MATWTCSACSASYPPGHEACPQCGADSPIERPAPQRKAKTKAKAQTATTEAVTEDDAAAS